MQLMQHSSLLNDAATVNNFAVANLFSMTYVLMHGQGVLLQLYDCYPVPVHNGDIERH